MSNFSNNIVALRKSKNLSQQQVATTIGDDLETYQKLEFDMQEPSLNELTKIAEFYEVDPIDLRNSSTLATKMNVGSVSNSVVSSDLKNIVSTQTENESPKSRTVTSVLAFFLGGVGAHNFYLGKIGIAVCQLILTLTIFGGIASGIWAFIEFILAMCGQLKDKDGKDVKKW